MEGGGGCDLRFALRFLADKFFQVNEVLPEPKPDPEPEPTPEATPQPTLNGEAELVPACAPVRRRLMLVWIGGGVIVLLVALLLFSYFRKHPLSPSGGLYFPTRLELPVEVFRQGDPRWKDDTLGWTDGTLGAEGCAVTSAAMVLNSYGVKTNPQELNWYLSATAGYTNEGWLYWERAADLAPDRVRHVYEDLPSYFLIDWNLIRKNPVIVRLRLAGGMTHFVVIAGKQGTDYLIRDPGAGASKGYYPLRELGSKIEALRFYRKLR